MRLLHRPLAAASAALAALTMTVVVLAPAAEAATTIPAVASDIRISEVESNGGKPDDWIELHNTSTTDDEDVSGWWLADNTDGDHYDIATQYPGSSVIPAGGYLALDVSFNDKATPPAKGASPAYFGLGAPDAARLYDPSNTLVDQVDWTQHADDPITGGGKTTPDATYSRCPGTHGESGWVVTDSSTKAAADTSCPAPASVDSTLTSQLKVNEVMADNVSDGSGNQLPDYIELTNTGTVAQDISGWVLSDDKATDADYLPAGSILHPGGHVSFAVGVKANTTYASQDPFLSKTDPAGNPNTDFGLGKTGDNAALEFPDRTDVDRVAFGADDATKTVPAVPTGATIGRCPDGTGPFVQTFTATRDAANVCGNPADPVVKLNEVDTATGTVELKNTSTTTAVDVSGWLLKDKAGETFTVPASSTIAAGAYLAVSVASALHFASAGGSLTVLDGTLTVDSTTWDHALTTSWGRCPDGTGSFADTHSATDGAANDCAVVTPPTTAYNSIRVNEIETNGDSAGDWIELANVGTTAVNISGMYLADDGGDGGSDNGTVSGHSYAIPGTNDVPTDTTTAGNTVLAPGAEQVFYSATSFLFGLGAPDMARLFTPGHVLVDQTAWQTHEAGVTYERCPGAPAASVVFTDTFGDPFINSFANSPGAANDCLPPIRINEVQANDPTPGSNDWVELTNVGNAQIDLTGYTLTDDTDTGHQYVIGSAATDTTSLAPGAFAAYNVDDKTHAGDFGLGKTGDEVRLYEPGAFSTATSSYDDADLVDSFVFEDTSKLPDTDAQLPQTVTLPGGTWPVDATDATSPVTYARCGDGSSQIVADGTGSWAVTATPTKGAGNQCAGLLRTTPWPDSHNGQADTTADNVDLGQNMSGLFYVAGATPAEDYMWGIENGTSGLAGANPGDAGELFKLVKDANGKWGPATGYEKGLPIRYTDGTGEPDAEGVTAVGGDVFAATERDNNNSDVSKIAVLEVDPTKVTTHDGDADGDLVATREWDLGPVLGPGGSANTGLSAANPGDANLGIEGVTFVPDSYLTANGFLDQSTGKAYAPADYPSHLDAGVFFVAMEKTGKLYGFTFDSDGSFHLVATVDTGFPTIMDVLWDPQQHALWADCDNSCQGRTSLIELDTATDANQGNFEPVTVYERPTGAVDNLNNEGFTTQPASECVGGTKSVWWSDDTDDADHWLRTASVDCSPADPTEVGATVTAHVSGTPSATGVYNAPVQVSFTCTDHDAVLNQPCPAPVTVSSTTAAHTVATLSDTLGNTYDATVPAIDIDTTAPSAANITITGPSGAQASTTATFTFTSSDSDVVGFACKLVGVDTAFAACDSGRYSATRLADGSYTFEVEAVDGAGNTSAARTRTFTVDTTAPTVAHLTLTGPSRLQDSRTAVFHFSSRDADVVGFACKLVGVDRAFVSCNSGTYRRTGLADGRYTFEVQAIDHVGNRSGLKALAFAVDGTRPTVRIGGPANGATYVGTGPVPTCVAGDRQSGIRSCTLRTTRTPTTVRITATAKDRAGNVATKSISYHTVPFYLLGATYRHGSFTVQNGRTYTVIALTSSTTVPHLIGVVAKGRKASGKGKAFTRATSVAGLHRFQIRVRISIRSGTWDVVVRVGTATHLIPIHR